MIIPIIPHEQKNIINPPCSYKNKGACECIKKPLHKDEFKKRVSYQAFKLDRSFSGEKKSPTAFDKGYRGIVPLNYHRKDKNPVDDNAVAALNSQYTSGFLKDWISGDEQKKCRFLAVIAMYNEQADELHETLEGIMKNLEYFTVRASDKYKITSNQIGCIVIVDGIEPFLKTYNKLEIVKLTRPEKKCFRNNQIYFSQFFNPEVIEDEFMINDVLHKEKVIDKDPEFELMLMLKESKMINDNDEIVHCFSQQISYDMHTLNLIFCVKQLNKRKLNTHLWFFEGFCSKINPEFVMLLDVGTKPDKEGLFLLYKAMVDYDKVAGCCGEIIPISSGFNPLVLAQMVEYKFSHILDKALESVIGYVSVLPGAFSAYRWSCINCPDTMKAYFKSQSGEELSLSDANMYLAEDRILCLELMCQVEKKNLLRFVSGSFAETDVPSSLNEFMAQRRRWINGSWFSMIYTIRNCNRIRQSKHARLRTCMFQALMVYYTIATMFNWLLVGLFYAAFSISIKRNLDETSNELQTLNKLSTPFIMLYVSILICIVITSLGVKPKKVENLYRLVSFVLGLYTYATIALVMVFMFRKGVSKSDFSGEISIALLILMAMMFSLIIIINGPRSVVPVVKGIVPFLFLTGTYVNLLMIYAICNIHDCSWGNRPDKQTDKEKKMITDYKNVRTRWMIMWAFCNCGIAYAINYIEGSGGPNSSVYINTLGLVTFGIIVIRFVGGILYVIDEGFCRCCHKNSVSEC